MSSNDDFLIIKGDGAGRVSADKAIEVDLSDFTDFSQNFMHEEEGRPVKFVPVDEYSIEGIYITSYPHYIDAAKKCNFDPKRILFCCRGKNLTCRNPDRIFLFSGDDIEKRLNLIEKKEEEKHQRQKTCPGKVQINEYSIRGTLTFVYPTMVMAAKMNNVSRGSISSCCRGKLLWVKNKIFLYENGSIEQRLIAVKKQKALLKLKKKKGKIINVYTLKGKLVGTFVSASEAARKYKAHASSILRCCDGMGPKGECFYMFKNKIFLYTGDSISQRLQDIKQYEQEHPNKIKRKNK